MLYYEFRWQTKDKVWHYTNCELQERGDQIDYLNKEQRKGRVIQWYYEEVEEDW